jgi:HK97 family phage prohead protease
VTRNERISELRHQRLLRRRAIEGLHLQSSDPVTQRRLRQFHEGAIQALDSELASLGWRPTVVKLHPLEIARGEALLRAKAASASVRISTPRSTGLVTKSFAMNVKALDDAEREFEGLASTPQPDRMHDVLEPRGAKIKTPCPLLWMHHHDQVVGSVRRATVSDAGIAILGKVAKVAEPGRLKELTDFAWQSIKHGLTTSLSVGFRPLESPEPREGGKGLRYRSFEILEVSIVSVPCNEAAAITAVR